MLAEFIICIICCTIIKMKAPNSIDDACLDTQTIQTKRIIASSLGLVLAMLVF